LSGIIVLNKLAARSFHILGVTSHYVIDKSMISISDMKKNIRRWSQSKSSGFYI